MGAYLTEPAVRLCVIAAGIPFLIGLLTGFMFVLMAAEIGGFLVLFMGFLRAL